MEQLMHESSHVMSEDCLKAMNLAWYAMFGNAFVCQPKRDVSDSEAT